MGCEFEGDGGVVGGAVAVLRGALVMSDQEGIGRWEEGRMDVPRPGTRCASEGRR